MLVINVVALKVVYPCDHDNHDNCEHQQAHLKASDRFDFWLYILFGFG